MSTFSYIYTKTNLKSHLDMCYQQLWGVSIKVKHRHKHESSINKYKVSNQHSWNSYKMIEHDNNDEAIRKSRRSGIYIKRQSTLAIETSVLILMNPSINNKKSQPKHNDDQSTSWKVTNRIWEKSNHRRDKKTHLLPKSLMVVFCSFIVRSPFTQLHIKSFNKMLKVVFNILFSLFAVSLEYKHYFPWLIL